jgi:peptidoglycan/xylan/chitin deacetylase (PgdA/CDA1 family)
MSLMLHSSYGAARMEQLAEAIQARGWVTITYRQAAAMMHAGRCPPPWAVIVSIDDLGTSWLRPEFKAMIRVFLDRGLTLVLGVVVGGQQDPEVWAYLRELESYGVEIASHTISHLNLPELEDEALAYEIQGSYQVICEWMGRCPMTLILPFGNGLWDERIPDAARDYLFVAGIPAGTEISGGAPYYIGRIGPDIDDAEHTLTLLYNTFVL